MLSNYKVNIFFIILFLFNFLSVYGQANLNLQNAQFNSGIGNAPRYDYDPFATSMVNSLSNGTLPWRVANGTPQYFTKNGKNHIAVGIGTCLEFGKVIQPCHNSCDLIQEGVFYPYQFVKGKKYTLRFKYRVNCAQEVTQPPILDKAWFLLWENDFSNANIQLAQMNPNTGVQSESRCYTADLNFPSTKLGWYAENLPTNNWGDAAFNITQGFQEVEVCFTPDKDTYKGLYLSGYDKSKASDAPYGTLLQEQEAHWLVVKDISLETCDQDYVCNGNFTSVETEDRYSAISPYCYTCIHPVLPAMKAIACNYKLSYWTLDEKQLNITGPSIPQGSTNENIRDILQAEGYNCVRDPMKIDYPWNRFRDYLWLPPQIQVSNKIEFIPTKSNIYFFPHVDNRQFNSRFGVHPPTGITADEIRYKSFYYQFKAGNRIDIRSAIGTNGGVNMVEVPYGVQVDLLTGSCEQPIENNNKCLGYYPWEGGDNNGFMKPQLAARVDWEFDLYLRQGQLYAPPQIYGRSEYTNPYNAQKITFLVLNRWGAELHKKVWDLGQMCEKEASSTFSDFSKPLAIWDGCTNQTATGGNKDRLVVCLFLENCHGTKYYSWEVDPIGQSLSDDQWNRLCALWHPKSLSKMMAQLESLEQQKVLEPQKTPSDFNEFVVYPNPTSEVLNVRIPVTSGDKKQQQQYQIKVVNMMGAEVKSVVLNSGDSNLYQIEVSELQPSTYLILVSANNTIYSSKFVKQ